MIKFIQLCFKMITYKDFNLCESCVLGGTTKPLKLPLWEAMCNQETVHSLVGLMAK